MVEWAPKRFWTNATADRTDAGWAVHLDGRPVRTPSRSPLILPTQHLAEAVAAEWRAQVDRVNPITMPMTRSANSALDKVGPQRGEVIAYISEYGATDLLCYRADQPEELRAQQDASWDPLLTWASETYGADLAVTAGVIPIAQPEPALHSLRTEVMLCDDFALTGLHDLVMLSGSLVIGLAAAARAFAPEDLWDWSRVDERWQFSQWGEDPEAVTAADAKRRDFLHAAHFHRLSQGAA